MDFTGIMEKKMETTILGVCRAWGSGFRVYWGHVGGQGQENGNNIVRWAYIEVMDKKMKATVINRGTPKQAPKTMILILGTPKCFEP